MTAIDRDKLIAEFQKRVDLPINSNAQENWCKAFQAAIDITNDQPAIEQPYAGDATDRKDVDSAAIGNLEPISALPGSSPAPITEEQRKQATTDMIAVAQLHGYDGNVICAYRFTAPRLTSGHHNSSEG